MFSPKHSSTLRYTLLHYFTLSPTLPHSALLFCGTSYTYAPRYTLLHSPSLSSTTPRFLALRYTLFMTPAKPPHMAVTAARSLPSQSGPQYELLPPLTFPSHLSFSPWPISDSWSIEILWRQTGNRRCHPALTCRHTIQRPTANNQHLHSPWNGFREQRHRRF